MYKQLSKMLLIAAAIVQGVFLLSIFLRRMVYGLESLFTIIFIVMFVICAFNDKKWVQILLGYIFFVYAIVMFMIRIEYFNDISLYLFILPNILLGIILLVNIKYYKNGALMAVLCIIQLVLLIVGEDLARKRNFIFVLIDLVYILTLNIPSILILINSIKIVLERKIQSKKIGK